MVRPIIYIVLFLCTFAGYAQTNRIIYENMLDSLLTASPNSDSILSLIVPADSFYTEDLRIPVSSIRLLGSNDPASTSYQGGEVLAFSNLADNSVFFDIQMPHAREADSDIQIHLHFALEDNGTNPDSVRWVLTYTWFNIDSTISAPTTVTYTDYVSTQVDSTHYYEVIATIDGTGKTFSSMLLCSLRRDVSEDDYGGDVYLMEIDAHYSARDIFTSTGGVQSGGSSDTTHYTTIARVIALQDSLDDKLNRSEYSPAGDTTHFVAFSKVIGLQDSINIANAYVDSNYVLTSETTSWDKDSTNDMTVTMLNDSNYVLTSETTNWDKDASNDILWTDTTSTIATQSDLQLGYQPLDADLTDLSDGSLTFTKVAGLQDSMNVANAYVDSNYVLTSETTSWDKSTTDDVEWSDTTSTIATQNDLLAYLPLTGGVLTGGLAFPIRTHSDASALTLDATNFAVFADATTNVIEIVLPDPTTCGGRVYFVKAINIDNGVSITGDIDGVAYSFATVNDAIITQSDGTVWKLIAELDGSLQTQINDKLTASALDDSMANYIDNTAYNATSWDNNLDAPTKNAVRDKIEAMPALTDGDKGDIDVSGSGATWDIDTNSVGMNELNESVFSARGHIWGLVMTNSGGDVNNDISVAVGEATNETTYDNIVLAGAIIKQLDAGWAVGTNQGGLNTGAEANSTWYEVHLIKRVDTGVVDVMFTTTANRATLPAGYTLQRRIGWIFNDASGNIKAFTQIGNEFTWTTQVNDGAGNKSTTAAQVTLSVPPYCVAKIRVAVDMNTSVNANSSFVVSEIPEGNVSPAVSTGIVTAGYWDLTTGVGTGQLWIRTDVNRQIEWDADVAQGTFDISTYGFIDEREQYGNY